ncbi:MAG TPA: CoA transferase [Acidimicrobiales bacterium]|nr:CoA transferase [Acidimicrobiales bacterium]
MSSSDPTHELIESAWRAVAGGTPLPVEVRVEGEAGHLGSAFRVEEAAVACVAVALAAAAALASGARGGPGEVGLHRAQVAMAVRSERYFDAGGATGAGFAPLSRFWPTADGWVRTHANYPWHKAALLQALGAGEEEVGAAMKARPSEQVEEAVFAAGGVAAAVRSRAEWRDHPQGRAVAAEPLVSHQRFDGAPPRRAHEGPLPAAGVRVIDLTRVIAGPVCTRYLGAMGAEVLRIDSPSVPDMAPGAAADTLLGKRSAALDLERSGDRARLQELLAEADVVVAGYRPGALYRFGLDPAALVDAHPGLVVVCLDAWGHAGPWAGRRGFDSVVQAPTGIADGESVDGTPGALPCQLLDHGTGYLAAAAVLDSLRRQRGEGGTYLRRLSLARTAAWLVEAGPAGERPPAPVEDERPWVVDLGPSLSAVGPPGRIGDRALAWPGPPARYQQDAPAWSTVTGAGR